MTDDTLITRFQIRIRSDDTFESIECIKDYLAGAEQGFAFLHDKPGNHHYHIYLFGLVRTDRGIRKTLGKYFDKQNFAVSTKATLKKGGWCPITPMLAFQYASDPSSFPTRVWAKGFSDENLTALEENAITFYAAKDTPLTGTLIVKEEHYIVRPDRVWERLLDNKDRYKDKTVKQIKSMIGAEWLNAGKAIPRPSDLHRYAVSLFYKNKYSDMIPDDALECEYA